MELAFRLLNVFTVAGDRLSGNPLCVFEDGRGLELRAPMAPTTRRPETSPDALAAMVGLPSGSVLNPLWVNTGEEQLVLPVRSADDVRAARPDPGRLARDGRGPGGGEAMAYVFAQVGPEEVEARFFFMAGGGVVEDPATGSACANLGGWLLATGAALPATRVVAQGAQTGRPSRLVLEVDAARHVHVTGDVVELGRGTIRV